MILKEMKMFATITSFDNVTRSAENALEDAFINNLNDLENSNFCENSDNKLPEVGEFEKSNETVNKFDESLIIANGGDSTDLLFYLLCYAVRFFKSDKINACDDKEIEQIIGSDLYNEVNDKKEHLQLDLDYQKLKKQLKK